MGLSQTSCLSYFFFRLRFPYSNIAYTTNDVCANNVFVAISLPLCFHWKYVVIFIAINYSLAMR